MGPGTTRDVTIKDVTPLLEDVDWLSTTALRQSGRDLGESSFAADLFLSMVDGMSTTLAKQAILLCVKCGFTADLPIRIIQSITTEVAFYRGNSTE